MNTTVNYLVDTMRRLGHATSRNLKYSYHENVPVSYGEETITESNLLELWCHHSDVVKLRSFTKHQESKNGADWLWWFRGDFRSLLMRVQAKRVQRDDVLKIRHKVGKSNRQQHALLVETAIYDNVRPMYCIYCTESQRSHWKQIGQLETGCLLVDARNLSVNTCNLNSVEWACWPWHLFFATDFPWLKGVITKTGIMRPPPVVWDGPNFSDLNEDTGRYYNQLGVWKTSKLDHLWPTEDSDARWPTEYNLVKLAAENELRWPRDADRLHQIDYGPQGMFMMNLSSLELERGIRF